MMPDLIELGMINLTPTMKCNLKCKLCGVLVPHYEYCPTLELDEMKHSLVKVFEFVDNIKKLQITGGEPLLYPKLPELIQYIFEQEDKFDHFWLITNGSAPFSSELEEVLLQHKEKTIIHLSDYGYHTKVVEKNMKFIKENNFDHRYLDYHSENQSFGGWVDQGDFICHHRDKTELNQVFFQCSHYQKGGSWYIRHGQMHWCGRSIRGRELDKIPDAKEHYVDLFHTSIEERKKAFLKLKNTPSIIACDYCNGDYGTLDNSRRYKAGEQL